MENPRFLPCLILAACAAAASAQTPAGPAPSPAWEIREGLSQPESAYYDPGSGSVFVSNVAGDAGAKDGEGWILRASTSGEVIEPRWVSGFNAPKGLRAYKGKLYVADIDEVVEIEIKTGLVTGKVTVPGAKTLNDVAVDPLGRIYVSDTLGGRVWRIYPTGPRSARVFLEGEYLESPNGLLAQEERLLVAGWGPGVGADWSTKAPGRLFAIDLKTKAKTAITEPLGNLDGLEAAPGGGWLVSDWVAGKVYRVAEGAKPQVLLEGFQGSADIGFVPSQNLLIVPRMKENTVTAYTLSP